MEIRTGLNVKDRHLGVAICAAQILHTATRLYVNHCRQLYLPSGSVVAPCHLAGQSPPAPLVYQAAAGPRPAMATQCAAITMFANTPSCHSTAYATGGLLLQQQHGLWMIHRTVFTIVLAEHALPLKCLAWLKQMPMEGIHPAVSTQVLNAVTCNSLSFLQTFRSC